MPSRTIKRINNKGPIIVVSGPPGSGKTTYAKRLSNDLGLPYFTTGSIFRELARLKGYSLEEFSKIAEKDPHVDFLIDNKTLKLALEGGVVIDSHLAAWVLAGIADITILVKTHPLTRVLRIAQREDRDLWEVFKETFDREFSQYMRFRNYYGYSILDYSHFDLVIDTGELGVEEVYQIIKDFVIKKLTKLGYLPENA